MCSKIFLQTTSVIKFSHFFRHFDPPRLTWNLAEEYCNQFVPSEACPSVFAHLMSIESAKENDFLLSVWRANRRPNDWIKATWIGYSDQSREGSWVWTDGGTSKYESWDSRQPDDAGGQDCAIMWTHAGDRGRWDDNRCPLRLSFTCKVSKRSHNCKNCKIYFGFTFKLHNFPESLNTTNIITTKVITITVMTIVIENDNRKR
ncbi:Aggrecan core protein [Holothuria leucospilota]|uniref:Aggrecan core protein n=1 Tax=Holothuria leucospilota TaxID=206669 RepID=A0A9Q1CFH5_HOLLE|nr:Aggrecan core protein [Holothuria leucospilota]